MINKQPHNIDIASILSYKLPLPGVLSILHRISGGVVFFMLPLFLWLAQVSLDSPDSFATLKECLNGFWIKLILWATVSGLLYHLVAGIKHLIMDLGIGETLEGAMQGAKITIGVSAVLILIAGGLIW